MTNTEHKVLLTKSSQTLERGRTTLAKLQIAINRSNTLLQCHPKQNIEA